MACVEHGLKKLPTVSVNISTFTTQLLIDFVLSYQSSLSFASYKTLLPSSVKISTVIRDPIHFQGEVNSSINILFLRQTFSWRFVGARNYAPPRN